MSLFFASCVEGEKKQGVEVNTPEEVKQEKQETVAIADASFTDGMVGKVFQNYLQLKAALVNSDAEGAKTAAKNMSESFDEERAAIKEIAQQLANTDDLEKQRQLFSEFAGQIEPLFTESISSGTFYKQFCPMAFDNQGAYWFSEIEEIKNPYYGEKMLTCGSVKETITKN